MSVSKLWVPYAVNLNTATLAASPVLLDQVQNFECSPAIAKTVQASDGAVDPTYVAVMSQSPRITFGSTALATILGSCGISGAVIDADGTYPGLVCWFQKMAEGGVRASGSNHLKLTAKEGILVPRSISAGMDGPATMTLEAVLTYDGTNDPIVIADSQALSGSPAVGELFTVGPVSINGTTLEGIQSIEIDFGIQVTVQGGDGQVWPTYCAIMSRGPSIRVRTTDVSSLSTFGLTGTAQGATDSVVYLRKVDEGGTRVADGTAQHLSFTVDEGHISVEGANVSQDGAAMADVTITPTYDGTAAIMVISTGTAIT